MKRLLIFSIAYLFLIPIYGQQDSVDRTIVLEAKRAVYNTLFLNNEKHLAIQLSEHIKIFNSETLKPVYSLTKESTAFDARADWDLLVTGDEDGNLIIYRDGSEVDIIQTGLSAIQNVKFSRSEELLASVSQDSILQVWHSGTDDPVAEFIISQGVVTDMEFSLDNRYLIISTSIGKVFLWDYLRDRIQSEFDSHKGYVRSIAVCPDSLRFASCGDDKNIIVYSIGNEEYYALEKAHKNWISDIEFINGNFLLSIGHDHFVIMNNINVSAELAGNQYYKIKPFGMLGDKYPNSIAVSNELGYAAISTLGKGVLLSRYFHNFIRKPHRLTIYDFDYKGIIASDEALNIILSPKSQGWLSCGVSRPESIKKLWLSYADSREILEVPVNKDGNFRIQVPETLMNRPFSINIEDIDKDLGNLRYDVRVEHK